MSSATSPGRNQPLDPVHHAAFSYRLEFPKTFFKARCAQPSVQPGPRPWFCTFFSKNSIRFCFPSTWRWGTFLGLEGSRSVLEELLLPAVEHSRPQARFLTQIRDWHFVQNAASEWLLFLPACSAFVASSCVRSVILTDERFLHFQLRQDNRAIEFQVIS